jgi:hypothetical protein
MLARRAMRHAPPPSLAIAGVVVFALAKVLKWWAILTLGRFLDLPGDCRPRRAARLTAGRTASSGIRTTSA